MSDVPHLLHTVLDADDVRREAEFWRELLGLDYRPGDEASPATTTPSPPPGSTAGTSPTSCC